MQQKALLMYFRSPNRRVKARRFFHAKYHGIEARRKACFVHAAKHMFGYCFLRASVVRFLRLVEGILI